MCSLPCSDKGLLYFIRYTDFELAVWLLSPHTSAARITPPKLSPDGTGVTYLHSVFTKDLHKPCSNLVENVQSREAMF